MTGGFFAILDDIASLLDDTATMTKVVAKQVGGVLGDDLAVNAEQASGYRADRELPVLWAITKGSLLNKAIIVPIALLLSAFAPWAISPILMLGALYLSFEGAEKIYEYIFPHPQNIKEEKEVDEKSKIKSAIRTDFILSIEIVVIALGVVEESSLAIKIISVTIVSILATIGVYGIVALMVRMDDMGYALVSKTKNYKNIFAKIAKFIGKILIKSMPYLIRVLGYIGTFAMLMVGGGIFLHHIPSLHHIFESIPSLIASLIIGLILGILTLSVIKIFSKIKKSLT